MFHLYIIKVKGDFAVSGETAKIRRHSLVLKGCIKMKGIIEMPNMKDREKNVFSVRKKNKKKGSRWPSAAFPR